MFDFLNSEYFDFEARPVIGLGLVDDFGTNPESKNLCLIVGLLLVILKLF